MGLAASQARLLLLTARKSDLEYRAQMISQRKIALAMETEQVATAYTEALNNRHLMFTYWASPNDQKTTTGELTYEAFTAVNNLGNRTYRLVDAASGKVVCADISEAANYVNQNNYGQVNKETGKFEWKSDTAQAEYNAAIAKQQEDMMVVPGVKNTAYLQDLIQTGAIGIEQCVVTEIKEVKDEETGEIITPASQTMEWKTVLFAGMDDVSSELYTKDDSAAMAEYETKSLLIQNQDKQLDVELKQVETQLEACKAEKESVEKLVGERAKDDFKLFG